MSTNYFSAQQIQLIKLSEEKCIGTGQRNEKWIESHTVHLIKCLCLISTQSIYLCCHSLLELGMGAIYFTNWIGLTVQCNRIDKIEIEASKKENERLRVQEMEKLLQRSKKRKTGLSTGQRHSSSWKDRRNESTINWGCCNKKLLKLYANFLPFSYRIISLDCHNRSQFNASSFFCSFLICSVIIFSWSAKKKRARKSERESVWQLCGRINNQNDL